MREHIYDSIKYFSVFNMIRELGGAGCRNRTRDIQFTKLALYQLS